MTFFHNYSANIPHLPNEEFEQLKKSVCKLQFNYTNEEVAKIYMAFVKYIKLSLMFVCHLDLYFWRLEPPVKDSFVFAEKIVHKDSKRFTGSLGVESLFTNIPLKKTINIYTNFLYDDIDVIEGIGLSLRNFYPWLPRNCILCLTKRFTNKRTM